MAVTTSLLSLAILVSIIVYKFLILPALISPLAKLPSVHPLCVVTSAWFERRCALKGELKTLYAAHEKHGQLVRLGPNEVSVVSEEGLRKVYTAGLDKTPWYRETFCNYGIENLVCTLNHESHSATRRMIAGLYTKSYLQHSSDLAVLSRRIICDKFLPLLKSYAREDRDVDVVKLFEWISVDFITGHIFGTAIGTDFLQDRASRDRYFDEWDRARRYPQMKGKSVTEALFMEKCKAAIASRKSKQDFDSETRPLVLLKMYDEMSVKAKERGMSESEVLTRCASEMVDHVIATQETNTITLTYMLYRLSLHPEWQRELRTELRTSQSGILADSNGVKDTLPPAADIDKLPLLDAIVYETLRLHAANPARMRRVVPVGGLELNGFQIPTGTTVSTNAYCLHRNKDVFPEPFEWKPERWLRNSGCSADAMRKWFWAFGSGPRGCIGQHFAMQVIKLIVAAIYTQYTTSIADDEGIEQSDSYNSGPISHRLVLQFHTQDQTD